jgi:hypothetical protein
MASTNVVNVTLYGTCSVVTACLYSYKDANRIQHKLDFPTFSLVQCSMITIASICKGMFHPVTLPYFVAKYYSGGYPEIHEIVRNEQSKIAQISQQYYAKK